MTKPPFKNVSFLKPDVVVEHAADGSTLLSSPYSFEDYQPSVIHLLRHWAQTAPDRVFLADRTGPDGTWRRVTYAQMWGSTQAISQALLERALSPERPVMILSANSVNHAMVSLGAMGAGIPVAPVSVAYSLLSQDFAQLRYVFGLVDPGLIYFENGQLFERALAALNLDGVEIVFSSAPPEGSATTPLDALVSTTAGEAQARALESIGPDTIAKYLFTSGSTDTPNHTFGGKTGALTSSCALEARSTSMTAAPCPARSRSRCVISPMCLRPFTLTCRSPTRCCCRTLRAIPPCTRCLLKKPRHLVLCRRGVVAGFVGSAREIVGSTRRDAAS